MGTIADVEDALRRLDANLVVIALDGHEEPLAAHVRKVCTSLGVECQQLLLPI